LGNTRADNSRVKIRWLLGLIALAAVPIGAVKAWQQLPELIPLAPQPSSEPSPAEIEIYRGAARLTDWTPQQIRECPVLHKLRPATSQDQLPMILERAGQIGDTVFADFPQVSCDEVITSDTSSGFSRDTKSQRFRYIVIPRPVGDVGMYEEYRTDPQGNPPAKLRLGSLYMITAGFASSWLYLSPAEQHDNHFRYFGIQTIRKRKCHVVAFAQDPEKARRSGDFRIEGKIRAALLLQGLAWIDTQTFQILQVTTWLLAPRTDVGLTSQVSTVEFYPVKPVGSERVLWLPRDVTVWAVYRGVAIRNVHRYTNFKLFRVESTIKP
jgi:hypothetical protein